MKPKITGCSDKLGRTFAESEKENTIATKIRAMNKEEFNQIATVQDLKNLRDQLINEIKGLFQNQKNLQEFYSPKEFQALTGIPYSTVIYKCKYGKLKARQEEAKGSWLIDASEVERYKQEAAENI